MVASLVSVFAVVLGQKVARGRTEVKQNRFGENALVADVGAEEVIIDKLKSCGLPMRIVSEEHGQLTTGDQAIATAIIDGLDGSSVYKKQGLDGRYSTMLGVLRGSKPRYKDTMTSGIIEHSRHRLLFSDRNSQTRVRDLISLQEQPPTRPYGFLLSCLNPKSIVMKLIKK
jgi:fructose-1,6-bisphosphatase